MVGEPTAWISLIPTDGLEVVRRISVLEILSIVGLVTAVVSLLLSMRAAVDNARTRSAEFSFLVWERFREDDVQAAFLSIEWGRFQYPVAGAGNGFATAREEREIDRLLSLLDDVAAFGVNRALMSGDVDRWDYVFTRVFQNEAIGRYMRFLDDFYIVNGVAAGPHQLARSWYERRAANRTARPGGYRGALQRLRRWWNT